MPPYVAPSPIALDQRALDTPGALDMVARALITITEGIQDGDFTLLLTNPLRAFIRDCDTTFDWSKSQHYRRLDIIYRLLGDFGLQKGGVEALDLSDFDAQFVHPLPVGTEKCPLGPEWAIEMGKLYVLHKECCKGRTFVGIGCMSAFSGGPLGSYQPDCIDFLPLVGPPEVSKLDDAYTWNIREEWKNRVITFDEAKRNIHVIGGTLQKPRGTSHCQVTFEGGRTWPLDSNHGEIPERFLAELAVITGYDLPVIKYALVEGELPPRCGRFKLFRRKPR